MLYNCWTCGVLIRNGEIDNQEISKHLTYLPFCRDKCIQYYRENSQIKRHDKPHRFRWCDHWVEAVYG